MYLHQQICSEQCQTGNAKRENSCIAITSLFRLGGDQKERIIMKRILLISNLLVATLSLNAFDKKDILWQLVAKRNSAITKTLTKDIIEKSTKPIIMKASAAWCPQCVRMEPIFKELERTLGEKYTFLELDLSKSPELGAQYKVKSLPTFIFIKNRKEVGRELGAKSYDTLKKLIEKYLS